VAECNALCPNCLRNYRHCQCGFYKLPVAESGMGAISSTGGVQLNNRQITSLGERPTYSGEHDMSDATIKELGWDLTRIVERETLVTTFSFGTSSAGVLYTGAAPGSMLSVAFAKTPFLNFLYWRGDVVLKLQIAGSPMVQGILGMTFVPLVTYSELQSMNWDFSSLSINPTTYLFANTNTVAELRIPYNHIQSYIGTTFPSDVTTINDVKNNLGFVVIYVLESFQTAGALTGVTVSLFSHLENSQFKVPQLSSTIESEYAKLWRGTPRAESNFLASAASSLTSLASSVVSPMLGEIGDSVKGIMSRSIRKKPRELAEEMASKALPSNFIGDAIDLAEGFMTDGLCLLGLDNPTIPSEENRTIVKGNGSLNYSVGPEFVEKLAVIPSSMALVTPETFATITDEMDVDYLYGKFSYVGRFVVDAADAVGSIVWAAPLSPFPTFKTASGVPVVQAGSIVQNTVWFPLLSYLGIPYKYWTGGLCYKFLVSSSSMHTCKLFVSFNYGVYNTTPTTLLDAASQYGIALEINQGSNEFVFSIPYVALTPYLEVCLGTPNEDNSMGTMHVTIMNELVAPASVSQSISVAVFLCGSDDFSYEFLAGTLPLFPVYDVTASGVTTDTINLATKPLYSSDRIDHPMRISGGGLAIAESQIYNIQSTAPTNVDTTVTDLRDDELDEQIAPPQVELVVDDHFGVAKTSLRNYAKKYQLIGNYNISCLTEVTTSYPVGIVSVPVSDIFQIPNYAIVSPALTALPQNMPNGLLTWMQGMYKQYKGSVRIKAVFNMSENITTTVISPFVGCAAYWYPGRMLPISVPVTNMSTMVPWIGERSNIITPAKSFINQNTPRLGALSASTSNVLEFEVPYSSQYLSVLNFVNDGELPTRFSDLGTIYFTCNIRESSTIHMSLYAAFGDESRFGTLYRIPSVYVPAVYTVASNVWTPTDNFGFGQFGIPSGSGMVAESGRLLFGTNYNESSIDPELLKCMSQNNSEIAGAQANTRESEMEGVEEAITTSLPSSSIPKNTPMNPQARRRNTRVSPITMMARSLRKAVLKDRYMSYDDMSKYLESIKPPSWRGLTIENAGGLFKKAGIDIGKDGRFAPVPRTSRSYRKRGRIPTRRHKTNGSARPSVAGQFL